MYRLSFCAALVAVASSALAQTNTVDLKVNDETIPPGQIVQIKTFLTEPKPISGGKGSIRMNAGLIGISGIAAFSTDGTVSGVAVLSTNGLLQIRFASPSASWGTESDYPLFTVAAQVSPNAQIGSTIPLPLIGNASYWLNPQGQTYVEEVHPGTLTVDGTVAVNNVVPGGGMLPAGSVVQILGAGFVPGTQVQLNEIKTSSMVIVNAGEIDVTLSKAADLTGTRVRVTPPSGNRVEYYSYLRATPDRSSDVPLIAAAIPVFPTRSYSAATFSIPQGSNDLTGLALQNPNAAAVAVKVGLYSPANALLATTTLHVESRHQITRELSEVLGSVAGGAYIRVSANPAVQMTAFKVDHSSGAASPISPSKAQ